MYTYHIIIILYINAFGGQYFGSLHRISRMACFHLIRKVNHEVPGEWIHDFQIDRRPMYP